MKEYLIFVLMLAYIVFRDVIQYRQLKRLQMLLFERTTPEEYRKERKRVKEDVQRELAVMADQDNVIPVEEADPEKVLIALRKEEFEEI